MVGSERKLPSQALLSFKWKVGLRATDISTATHETKLRRCRGVRPAQIRNGANKTKSEYSKSCLGYIQEFAFDNDISNDVSMGYSTRVRECKVAVSLPNGSVGKRSAEGVWCIFNPPFLIGSTSNGESRLDISCRQAIRKCW